MPKRDEQSTLERKIHLVAKNEIGLTRDERMELACYLLRRDITSWTDLDPAQVCRIADALEGFQLISELLNQRAMMVSMPSARNAAIQAVVDAWTVPGISPEYHAEWQARLSAPSEEGGWPVLARAIQQLVAVEQEHARGNEPH